MQLSFKSTHIWKYCNSCIFFSFIRQEFYHCEIFSPKMFFLEIGAFSFVILTSIQWIFSYIKFWETFFIQMSLFVLSLIFQLSENLNDRLRTLCFLSIVFENEKIFRPVFCFRIKMFDRRKMRVFFKKKHCSFFLREILLFENHHAWRIATMRFSVEHQILVFYSNWRQNTSIGLFTWREQTKIFCQSNVERWSHWVSSSVSHLLVSRIVEKIHRRKSLQWNVLYNVRHQTDFSWE